MVFRPASRSSRYASVLLWQRGNSHNRLRTVLSAMPWLGRFAASLAPGQRKGRHVGRGFENERLFACRSVSCVARASLDDGIQRHRPRSSFQMRMICNKAWQRVGPPFDQTFDRNNWRSGQTRRDRQLHFISLMAARRHVCSDDKTDRRNVRAGCMPSMSRHCRTLMHAFAGLGVIALLSKAHCEQAKPAHQIGRAHV